MKQDNIICCENCNRLQLDVTIERYSMHGHVAYLCPTCANILVREEKPERFFSLCCRAVTKQTNNEMRKVHELLSRMILVGLFFMTIVAAIAVVQSNNTQQTTDHLTDENQYLTFSELNRLSTY